jgi:hypothetical protein
MPGLHRYLKASCRTVKERYISNVCVVHTLSMRWICIYCHRIMDRTDFTDFISDSDNPTKAEYHAWRHLTPNEEETEAKAEMLLQLY